MPIRWLDSLKSKLFFFFNDVNNCNAFSVSQSSFFPYQSEKDNGRHDIWRYMITMNLAMLFSWKKKIAQMY